MKGLGILHYYLGTECMQNGDNITITQNNYSKDILSRYNMHPNQYLHILILMWSLLKICAAKLKKKNMKWKTFPSVN